MIVNVTNKPNLLVKQIRLGVGHSVYRGNGCVMVILIVLMVLMKIQRYIIVPHLSLVEKINLLAPMVDVSIRYTNKYDYFTYVIIVCTFRVGYVIMITIVVMGQMKEKNAMLNTKLAVLMNSLVKTSNVSENNIDVMGRTIVVIIRMKLVVVSN